MDPYILVNLKMDKKMEKEYIHLLMDPNMMEIIKMIKDLEEE